MKFFKHDISAHDDLKIKKLIRMHGAAGYGAYWYLVERIYANEGLISGQDVRDELYLLGIMDDDELQNLMDSFLELDLFHQRDDGSWESHRINAEIMNMDVDHQRRVEAGRKGGSATQAKLKQSFSGAKASSSRLDKTRLDKTESSPLQVESLNLPSNNLDSCTLAESHDSASTPDGVSAGGSAIVLTILTNKKEDFPITENLVNLWQETYPAVNVRQELQRMKSWAISNPTQRKTWQGMTRFCDNWLKKEQDRVKPSSTPSMFSSGIAADGSDPEKFRNNKTIAQLMREQEAQRAAR